jgi:hypothetical protein
MRIGISVKYVQQINLQLIRGYVRYLAIYAREGTRAYCYVASFAQS